VGEGRTALRGRGFARSGLHDKREEEYPRRWRLSNALVTLVGGRRRARRLPRAEGTAAPAVRGGRASLDNPFPDLRLLAEDGLRLRADWYRPFLMAKAQTAKLKEFFQAYGEGAGR